MKKMRFFSIILSIILFASAIPAPVATAAGDPAVVNGCHSVDAAMTISDEEKLVETAQAVVLYELNSQTMLYTWQADEMVYPTSMVKMMTTLVALENGDLDEKVTITRQMLSQVPLGVLGIDMKVDEEISLRDLLYATMVQSATDASIVVAYHVAGSMEAFVEMMNAKAKELGCKNTNFTNVHGLHDEQSYSTARDICRITEAALKNETFNTIFKTATYTIPATKKKPERILETTNYMMSDRVIQKYYDERVTGGKTGATDQGGRCLTLTAEKDGMEILCVLMGAIPTIGENSNLITYGSFEESQILVDYAFKTFNFQKVFVEGQSLAQYPVVDGANHVVTQAVNSVSTIMPVELDRNQLRWVYAEDSHTLTAPIEAGQKLGSVQVWYGSKCLAQTDMVAMNAVKQYQAPIVPEKPASVLSGGWLVLILILVGIAVIAFVIMFGIRSRNMRKFARMQRQKGRRRR